MNVEQELARAMALHREHKLGAADALYGQILAVDPNHADANHLRGVLLYQQGNYLEAVTCIQKAIARRSDFHLYHTHLGVVYACMGQFSEALSLYERSIGLQPTADAFNNLGNLMQLIGAVKEALEYYNKSLELAPLAATHSNVLITMNYLPGVSNELIARAHKEWGDRYGRGDGAVRPHKGSRDLNRRLRVGYVSSDYCTHSVASFISPLLEAHDREAVQAICYSNVSREDAVTERIRGLADEWISIVELDDQTLAQRISDDQVDILVDLGGHTNRNRLSLFGYKPAPIQVSWLGYPNTTGLASMDYRLTDAIADPDGMSDPWYSETLIRLPHGFLCYEPPENLPLVLRTGNSVVTFGSFNNITKMTPLVVQVWASILQAVPYSQLLLKSITLRDASVRKRVEAQFAEHGIPPDRLILQTHVISRTSHLEHYGAVDIALDPFPYNGTTTTCEALWMGVPVITLMGDRHSARVGASLLTQVGMTEFIASDYREYVALATELAANRTLRDELSRSLRSIIASSPLCNRKLFAKDIEAAYRGMWQRYLGGLSQQTNVMADHAVR